jgi:hypothetical protein
MLRHGRITMGLNLKGGTLRVASIAEVAARRSKLLVTPGRRRPGVVVGGHGALQRLRTRTRAGLNPALGGLLAAAGDCWIIMMVLASEAAWLCRPSASARLPHASHGGGSWRRSWRCQWCACGPPSPGSGSAGRGSARDSPSRPSRGPVWPRFGLRVRLPGPPLRCALDSEVAQAAL